MRPPWWRRQYRELKKLLFSRPSKCPIDLFGPATNGTILKQLQGTFRLCLLVSYLYRPLAAASHYTILSCPPRPPPPARPGQRTTRSPAPAAPGARVARAQNAPGSAQNDLRQGTAFSVTAARPPPGAPSRPAHTGLPRLPRPSPVSADAGRGWAKSSHAPWPSVWARPRRARRGNNRGRTVSD